MPTADNNDDHEQYRTQDPQSEKESRRNLDAPAREEVEKWLLYREISTNLRR